MRTRVAKAVSSQAAFPPSLLREQMRVGLRVLEMAAWGVKYLPVSDELGIRAQPLRDGGPKMWAELMAELREIHLGVKRRKTGPTVSERLKRLMKTPPRNDRANPAGHSRNTAVTTAYTPNECAI